MEELVTKEDLSHLLEWLSRIPSLGTFGIIAAIVLIGMVIGIWYYVKKMHIKISERKNHQRRVKHHAESKSLNEKVSGAWAKGTARVESIRQRLKKEPKKPRPKEPGG